MKKRIFVILLIFLFFMFSFVSVNAELQKALTLKDLWNNFVNTFTGKAVSYGKDYNNVNDYVNGNGTGNETGDLYVSSTPSSALLYVNDIYRGMTPITVYGLNTGYHNIRVTKFGYQDYFTTVYISAGQTTSLYPILVYNQTNQTNITIPNAPSNLYTNVMPNSRIWVIWQDNSNNEQGFKIERRTPPEIAPASTYAVIDYDFRQIATVGANINTYLDQNLQPNTRYEYRVRAYNSAGNSAYSNIASATTTIQNQTNQTINLTGHLYATSVPSSSNLYVDNIFRGTTPLLVSNLIQGNHPIKFTKDGYYPYETVEYIHANLVNYVNATLIPINQTNRTRVVPPQRIGNQGEQIRGQEQIRERAVTVQPQTQENKNIIVKLFNLIFSIFRKEPVGSTEINKQTQVNVNGNGTGNETGNLYVSSTPSSALLITIPNAPSNLYTNVMPNSRIKVIWQDNSKNEPKIISSSIFGNPSNPNYIVKDIITKKEIASNYDTTKINKLEGGRPLRIEIKLRNGLEDISSGGAFSILNRFGVPIFFYDFFQRINNSTNFSIIVDTFVPEGEGVYIKGDNIVTRGDTWNLEYSMIYAEFIGPEKTYFYLDENKAKNIITNSKYIARKIGTNPTEDLKAYYIKINPPSFNEPAFHGLMYWMGLTTAPENPFYVFGDSYDELFYNEEYFLNNRIINNDKLSLNHLFKNEDYENSNSLVYNFDLKNLREKNVIIENSFNYDPSAILLNNYVNSYSDFPLMAMGLQEYPIGMLPVSYKIFYDKYEGRNVWWSVSVVVVFDDYGDYYFMNWQDFLYGEWVGNIYPEFGYNDEFYKKPIYPKIFLSSLFENNAVYGLSIGSDPYPKGPIHYWAYGFIRPSLSLGGKTSVELPDQVINADGGPYLQCYFFPQFSNPPLPDPCPIARYRITWDQTGFLIGDNTVVKKDVCYDGTAFKECSRNNY